ncbi:hypothetical protein [Mesorhizobium sp.]|uniref:hypothetical protein n=1 Tax=Mesorhizobium sp. TaxID=1871066 RepID=UPI00257DD450|nr:hypothetical protein [Mesorhizobium sp.]
MTPVRKAHRWPEANLYLKHVPSIDISAEPAKSPKRRLIGIAAWAWWPPSG